MIITFNMWSVSYHLSLLAKTMEKKRLEWANPKEAEKIISKIA